MKILFELTHPKHFYQFRYLINTFREDKHDVKIIARDKDVLLQLLDNGGYEYEIYGRHKKKLKGKILNTFNIFINYKKIVKNFKPDYILSKASLYAVLIKPFTNARLVITPDSEVVWLTRKIVAPLSHIIITPKTYSINYGKKQKKIDGFFEECYLSPIAFTANNRVLKKGGVNIDKPYFVLRFISWDANHDVGHYGFTDEQKEMLVNILSQYGRVLISAEQNKIPDNLKKYLNPVSPNEIHNLLHFASMYIGDSQTMATESALLGTPSFRYNSFVGPYDMSNFIILEKKYNLLMNFSDFQVLTDALREMLTNKNLKRDWLLKRETYFSSKPDINDQMIENIFGSSKTTPTASAP